MEKVQQNRPLFPTQIDYAHSIPYSEQPWGQSDDAQWLSEPELTQDGEFQVFDDADQFDIADLNGNLYCVRRKVDESVPTLGTRGEQVAHFPFTRTPQAWHGYPVWPIVVKRELDRLRPVPSDVLDVMVRFELINEGEKSRLRKGDHI